MRYVDIDSTIEGFRLGHERRHEFSICWRRRRQRDIGNDRTDIQRGVSRDSSIEGKGFCTCTQYP